MAKKEMKGEECCSTGGCHCMTNFGMAKGVVLVVLAVLLLWQKWTWFSLEHTFALVMLLFGLKCVLMGVHAKKCSQ